MTAEHALRPAVETVHRGFLDAALPPVLTVASGDTVRIGAFPAGGPADLHPDPARRDPAFLRLLDEAPGGPGPHALTGPIHVEGAEPGDTLRIDILEVRVTADWGHVAIMPLLGTLPDRFHRRRVIHPEIDAARGIARLPWGTELPLAPFFGTLATAPPPAWGRVSTVEPRAFGGNMDNRALVAGTTLYLPVFVPGAGFSAGDGHGLQGDGEVCVTALETAVEGLFRLTVLRDLSLARPFAESPTHLISIGLDADLDDAAAQAVSEMIDHVGRIAGLGAEEAYMLCSLAGDLHVTQTVDGQKGCHMMLPKSALPGR